MAEVSKAENSSPIPLDMTDLHKDRKARASHIGAYYVPELPETAAQEMYERLLDAERSLASPTLTGDDYDDGTAQYENEIGEFDGVGTTLVTTEHATAQRRTSIRGTRRKGPEYGLAAIGQILHEDLAVTHLTMRGRQTGDANNDPRHPLKDRIGAILAQARTETFVSLHGMAIGNVSRLDDQRSYDVSIGVGASPNEQTAARAERALAVAHDLDLRAGINPPFLVFKNRDPIETAKRDDGTDKVIRFGATGNTTRQYAETNGPDNLAALQIELSGFLRLMPPEVSRDYKSRYMGAYVGYLLVKKTVEAVL